MRVIQVWNHLSAVASGQSWASLHVFGTTMPRLGRVPVVMSWLSPSTGTSCRRQLVRSSTKYVQGLCRTAYRLPPLDVAQFLAIPSAYTVTVRPAFRACPNTLEPWILWADGGLSSVIPCGPPPMIEM